MQFFTRYTPPESPSIIFEQPSMTDGSFKTECDINSIVKRCLQTGVVPTVQGGLYGDFADLPDNLQDSYALISDAQYRFMQLSSDVRKEFNNDPMQLLSFISDPVNKQRAGELGLIDVPAASTVSNVQPQETNVVNQPSDKGES